MSTTDEKLREAGVAWRAHVDAGSDAAATEARARAVRHAELDARRKRTVLRRRLATAAVAVGAAAVVAGVVALANPFERGWGGGAAADCAPPLLAVDATPQYRPLDTPAAEVVRPGQRVQVSGLYFVTDCYDSGQHGDPPPYRTVRLTLTSGAHETPLATVHPDHEGAFSVDVELPADLAPGHATLSTDVDVAQDLTLVVAGPTSTPRAQSSSSTNR